MSSIKMEIERETDNENQTFMFDDHTQKAVKLYTTVYFHSPQFCNVRNR